MNLNFGTLYFNNEIEYYTALGTFCNNKAFSISYEPNKSTGSYSDAYRMRKLSAAQNLLNPIKNAIRTGNRINCNSYVETLIKNHNFVQNGKGVYGALENVIKTVPQKYVSNFIEGFTSSTKSDDNTIIVYETENIKTTATALKKVAVPVTLGKKRVTVIGKKVKTKHDYIKENIRNTDIGQRGEKLVFEIEKRKLKEAMQAGTIINVDQYLKWVSLEDDSAGYDILSLDINNMQPMYIEVKTTIGNRLTPFYISKDELEYSKKYSSNYYLYRIYNMSNNVAEYFELYGDISKSTEVDLDAVNYLVTIK